MAQKSGLYDKNWQNYSEERNIHTNLYCIRMLNMNVAIFQKLFKILEFCFCCLYVFWHVGYDFATTFHPQSHLHTEMGAQGFLLSPKSGVFGKKSICSNFCGQYFCVFLKEHDPTDVLKPINLISNLIFWKLSYVENFWKILESRKNSLKIHNMQ